MIADILSRILLAPLLVLQVGWVVLRAERFPEAAGPRSGEQGSGEDIRILIVGDSSSVGVGMDTQDQALAGHVARRFGRQYCAGWRVFGQNGITTRGLSRRIDEIPEGAYDLVVVALGVNDVKNGVPLFRWRRDYAQLAEKLRRRFSPRLIVASGLPPIHRFTLLPQPLRWILGRRATAFDVALNRLCRQACDMTHISFDLSLEPHHMAKDRFHPGPVIYDSWADAIWNAAHSKDVTFRR